MNRYKAGMLALSRAGHDAGEVYVIMDVDEAYVYLVDGRIRTLDRPKKKKKKHVQLICREYDIAGATDVHKTVVEGLEKGRREVGGITHVKS